MTPQRYTPDIIARAEQAVSKIRGLSSCRISTDDQGEITEVHVVSTANKSPKLISRDVQSCLMAEMKISVDFRKIGVVQLESTSVSDYEREDPARAFGEDLPEFPVEEFASRCAFQSVNLFVSHDSVQVEVELVRDEMEILGKAKNDNPGVRHEIVVAEATLKAVGELLDDDIRLCLSGFEEVVLGEHTVFVVSVDLIRHRERKSLVGSSLLEHNANQTAVYATLDAVNRVLGVLKSRSTIEYNIK